MLNRDFSPVYGLMDKSILDVDVLGEAGNRVVLG
jgi:hypothetical protein